MLARYPGVTVVGTVAMAVAIALGALYFEALGKWQRPVLPVAGADRVVTIRQWDASRVSAEPRALFDFATWRAEVKSVEQLGAAIPFVRNLRTEDQRIEPVAGAEMSASGFVLMGTRPVLGRTLVVQDEDPGEPPVVVISHATWTTRFASDSQVIGRSVQLGSTTATIVGVMPEGFGFPVNQRIWVPLRANASTLPPRTGPVVSIFGRLAPGASMAAAQAEFDVIAARMTANHPDTHRDLRLQVTPYARPATSGGEAMVIRNILYGVNVLFVLLLAIICANVGTLVFARTATRGWEIAVRNALGAGRRRIVAQLFIEALVLAGLAAVVGLFVARVALGTGLGMLTGSEALPFWIDASLSWTTVLYAGLLTLVGAAIVGVLPALRVTRGNLQDALREGGSRATLKFGGFWTSVIVLQVAITVAFLPIAAGGAFESNRFNQRAQGIGAEHYLVAGLALDREDHAMDSATFAGRTSARLAELEQRLAAEPGVEQVTFADRLPVEDQFKYRIEVDTVGGAPSTGLRTSTLVHVSRNYFGAFGSTIVAGRDFALPEYESSRAMIVNESFVTHVLGGRNPIGQRIRIVGGEVESVAGDEWYEIVGLVRDFGWQLPLPHEQSAMYRPSQPVVGRAGQLALRVREPEGFTPRLRAIAAEVDPTLRLTSVHLLSEAGGGEAEINWALTGVAWLVSFIVLLLSASGIHALMSFIVSRRTREIGVRVALGAHPRRIVTGIFGRALLQVGLGIVVGSAVWVLAGIDSTRQAMLLVGANAVMLVAGITACWVPLRRALKVHPTEALRAEV